MLVPEGDPYSATRGAGDLYRECPMVAVCAADFTRVARGLCRAPALGASLVLRSPGRPDDPLAG